MINAGNGECVKRKLARPTFQVSTALLGLKIKRDLRENELCI